MRADAIYFHGDILTGVGLEMAHPKRVTAMAVAQGAVLATGSDAQILAQHRGTGTQVVDLEGAFTMPGFNDAHLHLGMAARILTSVDLLGARSLQEMQERVRAAAKRAFPGEWLRGGGWDHTLWTDGQLPSRADLDAATMGRPAILQRVDGHIAVANSAALAAAGITRATANPAGGEIDRNAAGEPTGILRETAMRLVEAPALTPEQRRRGLDLALAEAVRHGVTSVQDFSGWDFFLDLEQMEGEGKMPARVAEWLPFTDPVDVLEEKRAWRTAHDRMLRTTMLKGFLDGSLGSRTAAMKAPYADDATNTGLPRYAQSELNAMAAERARAGYQLGFHAIGDRAVEMALEALAAAQEAAPEGEARHRIEHSQVVSAGDFARYRELGVIASMQPNHLLTDMVWAEQRLGDARAKYAYAWRSFAETGVPLAFGTDYPVEPITPFRGIYAAITRKNNAGTETFHPEQKLGMAQVLYACTQGPAYAEFAETWKGKLAPGFVADFVVLDRDLTAVEPEEVLRTQVLQTVVGGRTGYQRL
ncbi:MAG TPA: amidohydrolase [Acidobacteriaceae bacterium]|nr:amidohydrolase [Acidobacteriaceae bacterium]